MAGVERNADFVAAVNRPLSEGARLPAISLFSGILGIEIGLGRAGFQTRFAIDADAKAQEVKVANERHLGAFPYVVGDIRECSADAILAESNLAHGEAAILAGGPPCQPFSKSGDRSGVLDERGQLFACYLDYLREIKPRAFLLENVRGMYSSRGGADFKLILDEFARTGYTLYWRVVDAANYGVPQFRQRLFLVGFREPIWFKFPNETHGDPEELQGVLFHDRHPFVTAREAIDDLAPHVTAPAYSGQFAPLLAAIPPGMNYSFYTAERGHPNPIFEWRSKYWYFLLKGDPDRPSLTIQAYPGNNTGPFHWEARRFAAEELRRLQTFPDWLTIDAPYFAAHRLLGNAVPPLLAEAMGTAIREALDADQRISTAEYHALRAAAHGRVKSGSGAGKGKAKLPSAA